MTIENRTLALLIEWGVPPQVKGFRFLHAAIVECYNDPNRLDLITKILYPAIAREHGVGWMNVERCIRHAVSRSRHKDYSNSAFIALAVWTLKQNEPLFYDGEYERI